jgi:bifunctional non-homologous end joining protein LigD
MSLKEYQRKRNFTKTAEPRGRPAKAKGGNRFVIQKHAASRLHYDFRLEIGGTLKSWAVPKGIPLAKGEKRLAVEVEDHPVSYIDFEGTIPKGQYGGGTVMVWDHGTFETPSEDALKELKGGKLHFTLSGKKLRGEWYLVRLRDDNQWLLIKGGSDMGLISKKLEDTSARSGKSMAELGQNGAVWQSKPVAAAKTGIKARVHRIKSAAAPAAHFVIPMLARPVTTPPLGSWLFELKLDGYRALVLKTGNEIKILSRNEKDLGSKFPEIVEDARRLKAEEAIIDGEIVAIDEEGRSSFQLLQAYALGETRPPLLYYAFDLLELEGKDWKGQPLTQRRDALAKLIPKRTNLRFSPSLGTDANLLLAEVRKHSLEGAWIRIMNLDNAAEPGSS